MRYCERNSFVPVLSLTGCCDYIVTGCHVLLSGFKLWVGKVNSWMCASLSLTECCDCYTGRHVLLSGCELWVGTAVKVKSYKCVLSLTEWCDCYTGHHMLLSGWEALSQYSNEGECWMYASHVIIGMFLLFLQAPKWKQVARRSQDRLDNFVLALFHCAPCIYRTTALLGDSKWLCVHVRYLLCYCSKFLYYTGLRETWSDCVFMFGMCCVIAVSLFLYYTELRETWSDCVFMFGICCCVIAVSLFLYYTGLRETWSDCVFMFGMCCVIAVSLFLYYTGWWLYIGSLMNNAR